LLAANPVGTDGAVVSGHAAVVTFRTPDFAERLPAASAASTVNAYEVPHVRPESAVLVPDGDAVSVPFLYTPYPVTPTLSLDAVHESVNEV
jgi:hypothetical protein